MKEFSKSKKPKNPKNPNPKNFAPKKTQKNPKNPRPKKPSRANPEKCINSCMDACFHYQNFDTFMQENAQTCNKMNACFYYHSSRGGENFYAG